MEKDIQSVSASILAVILDGLGALFLTLYALLIGPLGILRGPIVAERFLLYMWVLVPMRAMTRVVRAATDWRVGRFSLAIVQIDSIILQLVDNYTKRPSSTQRRVLLDLYTVLTRAYLHVGDCDKAMQVILQAQKHTGANRLPGLPDLDAKTAHLIRAGIAAGRMLEGGGLATMFIKTDPKASTGPVAVEPSKAPEAKTPNKKKNSKDKNGQIIPFPQR